MSKFTINLLQEELFPKEALLTLKRVVIAWGGLLVIMLLWLSINQYAIDQHEAEYSQLQSKQAEQATRMAKLEAELANNIADPALKLRLQTLKLLIANKEMLHKQLTNSSRTYVAGFASAMTELSNMHHKDISLQQVNINVDDMVFSGIARRAEAVPHWLSGFEKSVLLSGKNFHNFKLTENEQNFTSFEVSTTKNDYSEEGK